MKYLPIRPLSCMSRRRPCEVGLGWKPWTQAACASQDRPRPVSSSAVRRAKCASAFALGHIYESTRCFGIDVRNRNPHPIRTVCLDVLLCPRVSYAHFRTLDWVARMIHPHAGISSPTASSHRCAPCLMCRQHRLGCASSLPGRALQRDRPGGKREGEGRSGNLKHARTTA